MLNHLELKCPLVCTISKKHYCPIFNGISINFLMGRPRSKNQIQPTTCLINPNSVQSAPTTKQVQSIQFLDGKDFKLKNREDLRKNHGTTSNMIIAYNHASLKDYICDIIYIYICLCLYDIYNGKKKYIQTVRLESLAILYWFGTHVDLGWGISMHCLSNVSIVFSECAQIWQFQCSLQSCFATWHFFVIVLSLFLCSAHDVACFWCSCYHVCTQSCCLSVFHVMFSKKGKYQNCPVLVL